MRPARKPLVLMILDGWGCRAEAEDNAITQANTPCWDELWQKDPHALITTSGEAVGLPCGQMGNSEVGHMNIGAGRIVYQDHSRITRCIRDGSFQKNEVIAAGLGLAVSNGKTVHIMGLLSPGGVHSHEEHFLAAVELAAYHGAKRISVHAFLDGRDTPPRSAEPSLRAMQKLVDGIKGARIDTVCGRYYAMDRDQRWERIEQAYVAIVLAQAKYLMPTAVAALLAAYDRGESDEFVPATVIDGSRGVAAGDAVFFINFRADRARELCRAFVDEEFPGFERQQPRLSAFLCMTEYMEGLPVSIAFPPITLPHSLAEILAVHGLRQLRIAETEKYAHVTFFFNGGREDPYPGEDRILIPSPKIATYDLQPEMSAPELTRKLTEAISSNRYDVIICNVANPDMVGHTGDLAAAIRAVEVVDRCMASTVQAIEAAGGELLITADHGNVEQMRDDSTGQSHTAHTTNPVPLVFHGRPAHLAPNGTLRDIAPTMLHLLGLPQPQEMTGRSLLELVQ